MCSPLVELTIVTMISYFPFLFSKWFEANVAFSGPFVFLSCDLVSGAIGFSRKELYSLLASEIMWVQNLLMQSGPLYWVRGLVTFS